MTRHRAAFVAAAVAAFSIAAAGRASAQGDEAGLRPGHLSLSGGLLLNGGYAVGDRNAELRRSGSGTPPPLPLFRAESSVERARGGELRLAYALTRALAVEVGGTYAAPQLAVVISGDDEVGGGVTIAERVSQYTLDLSGVYQLPGLHAGRRMRPYAVAGAGYLRQLYDGNLVVETGATYHAGLGLRYWVRGGSPAARALGVRGEVRYVRRTGGVEFEERSRGYPSLSLLAFAGF